MAPKAYSPRCSKCGCEDVHTRHVASGDLLDQHAQVFSQYDRRKADGDRLVHYCRGCSYRWDTPTLDVPVVAVAHAKAESL